MCDTLTIDGIEIDPMFSGIRITNATGFDIYLPERRAWKNMWQYCTNPSSASFQYCGGAGITVCDRWAVFADFIADLGERPDNCYLARIDKRGPFCPENCEWRKRRS